MRAEIKMAFEYITAEDNLKEKTRSFLRDKIKNPSRGAARNPVAAKRFALVCSSAMLLILCGVFAARLYFTPYAYVDIDVNPSVEIGVNRWGRVVDTHAYNPEGEKIIRETSVKYQAYEDAVGIIIDNMARNGYMQADNLISITLQTNGGAADEEQKMLYVIESSARAHHDSAAVEVFTVDGETRSAAYSLNLSPAKYLAIQDLMDADPTATIEGCRHHSIGKLRQLTEAETGNKCCANKCCA